MSAGPCALRVVAIAMAGIVLGGAMPAHAADTPPGNPDTIEVNALRKPEVRKYAAIVAGLDAFERHRAMAPNVDALRFQIEPRGAAREHAPAYPEALTARLEGDGGFVLQLYPAADGSLTVPRSDDALDARSELLLNRKRRDYRIVPMVRTPGLPPHVRRLGDLRLECQVTVAIGKEEVGTLRTLFVNSLLLTSDWCAFFNAERDGFTYATPHPVVSATMREGERSRMLQHEGRSFRTPLNDPAWSDDALVELVFAPSSADAAGEPAPQVGGAPTGTAAEMLRTGP